MDVGEECDDADVELSYCHSNSAKMPRFRSIIRACSSAKKFLATSVYPPSSLATSPTDRAYHTLSPLETQAAQRAFSITYVISPSFPKCCKQEQESANTIFFRNIACISCTPSMPKASASTHSRRSSAAKFLSRHIRRGFRLMIDIQGTLDYNPYELAHGDVYRLWGGRRIRAMKRLYGDWREHTTTNCKMMANRFLGTALRSRSAMDF